MLFIIKLMLECFSIILVNIVVVLFLNWSIVLDVYIFIFLKNGDIGKVLFLLEKYVDFYNLNKYIDVFEIIL